MSEKAIKLHLVTSRRFCPLEGWLWLVSKVVEKVVVRVAELSVGEALSAILKLGWPGTEFKFKIFSSKERAPLEHCDHVKVM